MKTGIVISVFDKIQELEISINLALLAGFDEILVVCENDALVERITLLQDEYLFSLKIVESTEFVFSPEKFNFYQSITPRVWEAQRLGILELSEQVDYVMHTHSDGWILKSDSPERIINEMIDKNCDIAFRGVGFTYQNLIGSPLGTIDDHFYIVKSSMVRKSIYLKKPLVDYVPGLLNIHGVLSVWIISEIGLSKSYHYDNTRNWLNWDGTKRNFTKGNPLRAYVLNDELGLLHCHSDDFPNELGKALQARELLKYVGENTTKKIKQFINDYNDPDVEAKLVSSYSKLRKRLNFFLDTTEDYKNIATMEKRLSKYKSRIFVSLLRNSVTLLSKKFKVIINLKLKETLYPSTIHEVYEKSELKFKKAEENAALAKIKKNNF